MSFLFVFTGVYSHSFCELFNVANVNRFFIGKRNNVRSMAVLSLIVAAFHVLLCVSERIF